MGSTIHKLRVFLSSPSDVQAERLRVPHVIQEVNQLVASHTGFVIELLSWETHVRPGMGEGPQEVINRQIPEHDLFVGILWHRFGTPTRNAESGTEEEFNIAYQRWLKERHPEIFFYFSAVAYIPKSTADLDQHKKVFFFKEELSYKGLYREYSSVEEFESLLRKHLTQWLLEQGDLRRPPDTQRHEVKIGDIEILPPRPWKQSNIVKFSISYTGDGLAFIKTIRVKILNVRSFQHIAVKGPGAIPEEYRFKVSLLPQEGEYQLNTRPFVYKKNELDMFRIDFRSPGGYQYDLQLLAEWNDKRDEIERTVKSHLITISFPVHDIDEVIRILKREKGA